MFQTGRLMLVFVLLFLPSSAKADSCPDPFEEYMRACNAPLDSEIPVRLNAESFGEDENYQARLERQVVNVIDEWNRGAGRIQLLYEGRSTVAGRQDDYINIYRKAFASGEQPPFARLMCKPDGYCTDGDPAGPYACINNQSGCIDTEVLKATGAPFYAPNWCDLGDLRFNPDHIWRTTDEKGESGDQFNLYFWGTLMHELGHALGHLHRFQKCSVLDSLDPGLSDFSSNSRQRYLWQNDMKLHREDSGGDYGYGLDTSRELTLLRSDGPAAGWSEPAAQPEATSNLSPALAFSRNASSPSGPAYCVAWSASNAPYGIADQILTRRGDGSSWDFSHPNEDLEGFVLGLTSHGLDMTVGDDQHVMAWVDTMDQSDSFRIMTTTSEDCRSWSMPKVLPHAHARLKPALAYDHYYDYFILIWVDDDNSFLMAATRARDSDEWSAPQWLGYKTVLAPAITYGLGPHNGTVSYASARGWGHLCSLEMYVDGLGKIHTSGKAGCTGEIWVRDGIGGAWGYDWDKQKWLHSVGVWDFDFNALTGRLRTYTKSSSDWQKRFGDGATIISGVNGARTAPALLWSHTLGFYEFNMAFAK